MKSKQYAFLLLGWAALPVLANTPPGPAAPPTAPAATVKPAADDRIRVQISAQQQAVLSAEIAAKLLSLPYKEGDAFRARQTLASFDCSIQRAQLGKATATAQAAKQTLEVNRRLSELNSISTLEVSQSEGKLKEAEAEVSALNATLSKCSLTAPFSGRIAKVHAENHQFVTPGKPLIEIVDASQLELRLIVPSRWLAWLHKGARFTVRVDELDRDVTARITRIGARIDPVNQTVSVVAETTDRQDTMLPGMSGWATFSPPVKK